MVHPGKPNRWFTEEANASASQNYANVCFHTRHTAGAHTYNRAATFFMEFVYLSYYTMLQTHKQPVTEYEAIREKAASQKRDIEKALTKFLAKTSETHNLFNTDDNQVYPCKYCNTLTNMFLAIKVSKPIIMLYCPLTYKEFCKTHKFIIVLYKKFFYQNYLK